MIKEAIDMLTLHDLWIWILTFHNYSTLVHLRYDAITDKKVKFWVTKINVEESLSVQDRAKFPANPCMKMQEISLSFTFRHLKFHFFTSRQ